VLKQMFCRAWSYEKLRREGKQREKLRETIHSNQRSATLQSIYCRPSYDLVVRITTGEWLVETWSNVDDQNSGSQSKLA
jgi:hypothetical protein